MTNHDAASPTSPTAPVELSTWGDAMRLSVGTLTRIPVAAPSAIDRRAARRSVLLAGPVGLVLALPLAPWAWWSSDAHLLFAVVAVAFLAWGSRGLHWDGVADTADAWSVAMWDRSKALAIMKRGDIGPMGTLTVVLVILIQVGALFSLAERFSTLVAAMIAIAAVSLSRALLAIATMPSVQAAREDGLGATLAGSATHTSAAVGIASAAAIVALVAATTELVATQLGIDGHVAAAAPIWIAGTIAGAFAALGLVRSAVRRFGGITGDVLGAMIEAAVTSFLVTAALI